MGASPAGSPVDTSLKLSLCTAKLGVANATAAAQLTVAKKRRTPCMEALRSSSSVLVTDVHAKHATCREGQAACSGEPSDPSRRRDAVSRRRDRLVLQGFATFSAA